MYSKERVKPEQLSTYEDLASPKWKGKIVTCSSTNVYQQSWTGSMMVALGMDGAETWAKGLVANFARAPPRAATATRSPPWPRARPTSPSPTPTTWPAC